MLRDSAADITGAIQEILITTGRSDVSTDFLRRYIGRHLLDLFLDLGYPREAIDGMITDYRAIYLAHHHSRTSVFPGIAYMLPGLGGPQSTPPTLRPPTP